MRGSISTSRTLDIGRTHPLLPILVALAALRPAVAVRAADDVATHWSSTVPLERPRPETSDPDWAKRELDHFVLAGLDTAGLRPAPDADPRTLLRRLTFDLVGLPPSTRDIARFIEAVERDDLDAALASEVERLLESPAYGERWGRHWLDVARFAESSGKEANISFPYAWRYRDYVIDSVARDVPFDRFVTEQVAGDLLPYTTNAERARLLIATGFLAIGSKNLDEANERQFAADLVDEQIDTTTRAVLATSVACARCHDHPFDPYTMTDYYALSGIFESTRTFFGTAVSPSNRVGGDPLLLPEVSGQVVLHRGITPERVRELKQQMRALKQEEADGRAAVRRAIENGEDPTGLFTLRDALRIFWRTGGIEGQLEKVDENGRPLPLAMGVLDRETIVEARLLAGGDVNAAGEPIARRFPEAIDVPVPAPPKDASGRLELARWLVHPDNPLTSRVHVNRVWRHLFGTGLVRTVDNFGRNGEPPSHPGLLDELALRFIAGDWSTKAIVREIVLSRTYRQSSRFDARAYRVDPENRLLWRMSKRRLDAEAIRDAMLTVSGELDRTRPRGSLVGRVIGDRPISLIGLDKRVPRDLDGATHRSVYLPVIRDRLPDVLDLFDFAEPSLVTGDRETTNVPVQALYLMNGPFVRDRAAALADRVRDLPNDVARINRVYSLAFARAPDAGERRFAEEYLAEVRAEGDADPWASYCQAVLATAEFRNLD